MDNGEATLERALKPRLICRALPTNTVNILTAGVRCGSLQMCGGESIHNIY